MPASSYQGTERRRRLRAARLCLVCDTAPGGHELAQTLRGAIAGGVQVVQLRDKRLGDDELVAFAHAARVLCERLGALLIVNDRPTVAVQAGADGVHVGQEDMGVAEVRELVGEDLLIGLSTHAPHEIDRAGREDGPGRPTTSASARSTPPPPSPGARLWDWSSCAMRPLTPPCRSSRSGASTRATWARSALQGRVGWQCCERYPMPRTPSAPPGSSRARSSAPARERQMPGTERRTPARERQMAGADRDELARAALEPLGEGEWPRALVAAIAVAGALALGILVSLATVHDLRQHGGSVPGGAFLAAVLVALALGMYRRRYWAVLAFEGLLAFQILVTSLALVVASTVIAAGGVPGEHRARGLVVLEARRSASGRIQAERPAPAFDRLTCNGRVLI